MVALGRRPIIHGLYVVANRVEEEAAVVGWAVFWPGSRGSIVLALCRQACLETGINGSVAWRASQQMYT